MILQFLYAYATPLINCFVNQVLTDKIPAGSQYFIQVLQISNLLAVDKVAAEFFFSTV
jgi:hypothetical protein